MQRLFGSLGLLLGSVGMLACLAAIAGVWWFSTRYLNQAGETVKAVDTLLSSVENRFGRLDTGLRETGTQVAKLRQSAQEVAAGNQADPAFKAKVERLVETLNSKIERAEDVAQLLRNGAGLVASISDSRESEGFKNLETVATQTATTLEEVRSKLQAVGEEPNQKKIASSVDTLAGSLESILNEVTRGVSEVGTLLQKSRGEIESLSRTITFWKTWGPWIVTGVLIWLALGQFALFAWSWSAIRGAPAGGA